MRETSRFYLNHILLLYKYPYIKHDDTKPDVNHPSKQITLKRTIRKKNKSYFYKVNTKAYYFLNTIFRARVRVQCDYFGLKPAIQYIYI